MRRGSIVTVAGGSGYGGKPRPAVVLQGDQISGTASLTVGLFTTTERDASYLRIEVEPSATNGLRQRSFLMVDKLTTLPRNRIGPEIGRLGADDLARISAALTLFFDLVP